MTITDVVRTLVVNDKIIRNGWSGRWLRRESNAGDINNAVLAEESFDGSRWSMTEADFLANDWEVVQ